MNNIFLNYNDNNYSEYKLNKDDYHFINKQISDIITKLEYLDKFDLIDQKLQKIIRYAAYYQIELNNANVEIELFTPTKRYKKIPTLVYANLKLSSLNNDKYYLNGSAYIKYDLNKILNRIAICFKIVELKNERIFHLTIYLQNDLENLIIKKINLQVFDGFSKEKIISIL